MQASFSGRALAAPAEQAEQHFTCSRLLACARKSEGTCRLSRKNTSSLVRCSFGSLRQQGRSCRQKQSWSIVKASSNGDEEPVKYNKEFGYSRKDVLLLGAGLIGIGYALYYGAQAVGIEATAAGNYVQLFIFLVICVGYVSTYIFRVANKEMTYTKQLETYEERVMQKRLEEMPETERERLIMEVEEEKQKRAATGK